MKGVEATRRHGKVSGPAIAAEDEVKEKGEGLLFKQWSLNEIKRQGNNHCK